MSDEPRLLDVLRPAKIDEAGIGDDPHAERHQAVDVVWGDEAAVLDAKARHLTRAAELGFGGLNRRDRFFQFFELGHVEGAIESAFERAPHRARETGSVVLVAGHKLGARQADARSERELLASFGVVEILAADHHADALANRA